MRVTDWAAQYTDQLPPQPPGAPQVPDWMRVVMAMGGKGFGEQQPQLAAPPVQTYSGPRNYHGQPLRTLRSGAPSSTYAAPGPSVVSDPPAADAASEPAPFVPSPRPMPPGGIGPNDMPNRPPLQQLLEQRNRILAERFPEIRGLR